MTSLVEVLCGLKKLSGVTFKDGVYELPFNSGYKWAFKLNKTDTLLSRTKKQAQCKFVKFCAMKPNKRKEAFYQLPDKERDWV